MAVRHVRELEAWQLAMQLVKAIYLATKTWPRDEIYGLTSQIRRAAVAIPSNVAEGQGRNSPRDFVRFLSIAYGSLMEVQTQTLIAQDLGYVSPDASKDLMELQDRVARILNGLMRSLRAKLETTTD